MTEPVRGAFRKPFAEQVAAFRLRLGNRVPTARWDDIERQAHDRAFMVAGAAKADLLADLAAAVDRAIADGTGYEAFKSDFRAIVDKHGWRGWTGDETEKRRDWRMRTIYRTNMRTSYMAGRHAQLREGGFRYWVYRHGGSLEPRLQHLAWDGLILEATHLFWDTHYPPNDWGCSCRVFGARSIEGAKRRGGKPGLEPGAGWDTRGAKTGTPPGIGKGWDYAPGASVADTVSLAAVMIERLPVELGSDLGSSIESLIDRHWPIWVADVLAGGRHEPGLVGVLGRPELSVLRNRGLEPVSAELLVRPGLLRGPKATRHEKTGDALSPDIWSVLPALLRKPTSVLLDTRSGNVVYILESTARRPQIAVSLDFKTKVNRQSVRKNMVVSAYMTELETIRARVKGGAMILLSGDAG